MTVKWFCNTHCYHRSSYCNTLPSFVYIHRKKEYWIHFQFCFPSIVDLWSNLSPFFPFLQWLPFVPRFRKCFYSFPAIPLTGAIECPPLPPFRPLPPLPPLPPFDRDGRRAADSIYIIHIYFRLALFHRAPFIPRIPGTRQKTSKMTVPAQNGIPPLLQRRGPNITPGQNSYISQNLRKSKIFRSTSSVHVRTMLFYKPILNISRKHFFLGR